MYLQKQVSFSHSKSTPYKKRLKKLSFVFALYVQSVIYLHKKIKTKYNN